ncbi:hypothetical protein HSBAA_30090 [Vreelandella sulfidaeris]|uniref:Uncharacterized protein n=1 Tax=Vreelandella sulfidaeris TaxID=115553 RepID=A0A455U8Z0_9GAMM|nr:hypothetical protein HSBAA_30090 [Halomonas sulfidaeris]
MHMAWVRTVCGRLKSDYRYSSSIVYNNFVWPEPTEAQRSKVEQTAQQILDARLNHPEATLADLYDPLAMPSDLRKAHQANDKAVDAAYGKRKFKTEAERVGYLFELYKDKISNKKRGVCPVSLPQIFIITINFGSLIPYKTMLHIKQLPKRAVIYQV